MKQYFKTFVLHGLVAMGFGPIVLAIVYWILSLTGVAQTLSVEEAVRGILSITVMAFIAGGAPVIYTVDRLPLISAILLHAGALYLDYLVMYLVNDWIPKDFTAIGIFTAIFIVGFALVWLIIYLVTRSNTKKLNAKLSTR